MVPKPRLRLLDQVRQAIRLKNYSYSTEKAYTYWTRRFIVFHNKQHPRVLDGRDIEKFLSHLAVDRQVSASTQNQALCALLFLYREVLRIELDYPIDAVRAKRPKKMPTVLSKSEVRQLLDGLSGKYLLMAMLLYGAGLRLMECIRIRVKDVDVDQRQILIRDGKGQKDRVTVFPDAAVHNVRRHLRYIRLQYEDDLSKEFGGVSLPNALAVKYPRAPFEWKWQYVFPSSRISRDPRSGKLKRHHADPSGLRKAIRRAAERSQIEKHVTPHVLRHSFATHLLEDGYDIRTLQELLGHNHVTTTMIYAHVLNRGAGAVQSPLDSQ